MHPLSAGDVPRRNILLRIFTCEPHLVTCLTKQARHQPVSVLNVKPPWVTHIPIFIPLVYIGKVCCARLMLWLHGWGDYRSWEAGIATKLGHLLPIPTASLCHVVHKWIAAATAASVSSAASAYTAVTASLCSLVEFACGKCLLVGDCHTLDG